MAMTFAKPLGTFACPWSFLPQATTVPLLRSANPCPKPAAIALIPDLTDVGNDVCPKDGDPHANTLPALVNPIANVDPAATSINVCVDSAGGMVV